MKREKKEALREIEIYIYISNPVSRPIMKLMDTIEKYRPSCLGSNLIITFESCLSY